jgi:anti-anti-sigma factor
VRVLPNIGFEASVEGPVTRLSVSGELDLLTRAVFEAVIEQLRASTTRVRLDLSGVEFIDAAGLHVLERAITEGRHDGWLELEPPVQPQVRRLLELTNTRGSLREVEARTGVRPARRSGRSWTPRVITWLR